MTKNLSDHGSFAVLARSDYKRLGTRRSRGDLRNEILDAVGRALRSGSYESLSMEHVAAQASISRRTLYNLFVDKDDLYRSSRERLLKSVSDMVTDEVPTSMSAADGMRFFVACCMDVYASEEATDIMLSVVRDGAHQQWLVQAYHRDVHDRLVRTCENFILKLSHRALLAPDVPRYIGEQLVGIVKSLTVGPHIFGNARPHVSPTQDRLEVLAEAYSAILESRI